MQKQTARSMRWRLRELPDHSQQHPTVTDLIFGGSTLRAPREPPETVDTLARTSRRETLLLTLTISRNSPDLCSSLAMSLPILISLSSSSVNLPTVLRRQISALLRLNVLPHVPGTVVTSGDGDGTGEEGSVGTGEEGGVGTGEEDGVGSGEEDGVGSGEGDGDGSCTAPGVMQLVDRNVIYIVCKFQHRNAIEGKSGARCQNI